MNRKCLKCGKKIEDIKYLLQAIVYLGKSGERLPICPDCYAQFIEWVGNTETMPVFAALTKDEPVVHFESEEDS